MYHTNDYIADYGDDNEIKAELRKRLAAYFECGFALPVANGTVAIEIALKALDIERGSLVILPDISFIATATAVANCGLIPVYADISADYFGLTLASLESKYNQKVRAVIAVHYAGFVNREIFAIKDFCKNNHLYLIEDCAQAFAASISGKKVGTIGNIGTYSLQSSKLINCGEGGFLLTDHEAIATKCDMLANWGNTDTYSKFDPHLPSSNFRLSAVQSYLVLKQLAMVDEIVAQRLSRVSELEAACDQLGVEPKIPAKKVGIFDCPFSLPVKSKMKINTLEPRVEYPMRKSNIVKAIFKRFFPDLLGTYNESNKDSEAIWTSNQLLEEVDFINISQQKNKSCKEILEPYKL